MKQIILLSVITLGVSAAVQAQPHDGSARPPMPPILQALDANGDGVIDADEIANASAALKKLDTNGDGQLTHDELMPGHPAGAPDGARPHRVMPLVAALDTDANGVISAEEIAKAPASLKALDKNGDGQLTLDEIMPEHPDRQFGHGHPPFASPIIAALDSDTNGIISAEEIAAASTTLKALDKNGDGQLTVDEFSPRQLQGMPGNGNHPRFVNPVVAALDTNRDGVISAEEIANAPAALKTLDQNGDGQLNGEELFPKPPGGFASPQDDRPRFGR